MNKKEVINLYFSLMKNEMAKYGFKQKKSELEFTKKTDFGFQKIILQVIDYSNLKEFWIHFRLQIRHNDVQELINEALKIFPVGRETSVTTNTHFKTLMDKEDFKYIVKSENDIENSVEEFMAFFNNHCLNYFEKYSNVTNLNTVYKEFKSNADQYFGPFGWYKYVVIVNFLSEKDSFKQFVENFYKQLPSYGINESNIVELKSFVDKNLIV